MTLVLVVADLLNTVWRMIVVGACGQIGNNINYSNSSRFLVSFFVVSESIPATRSGGLRNGMMANYGS